MKTISKFAVIGFGLALAPWTIFAQAPAAAPAPETATAAVIPPDQQPTKEQLYKLFEVMHLKDQMQSMMKMMPALIQQQVKEQQKQVASKLPGGVLKPEQQEDISKIMDKYMEKALSVYSIDQMLEDLATIYQRHLSRADVDAYIAFYGSPAGQHLLNLTPVMMQEYMPMAMKRMQESTKTLTDDMTREMLECIKPDDELIKAGPPSPPPPPAKDKPAQK
jgi:hypothetical protein